MSKVKINKEKIQKYINDCRYGLAVAFVKTNSIEERFISAIVGISKEELKEIEKEDIENLRDRIYKGGK